MFSSIIILFVLSTSDCEGSFFVVEKFEDDKRANYYCLTNSSSAISWIGATADETIVQQKSVYVPKDSSSSISWNYWTIQNSLNGNVNELILDKRWEGLQVYTTTHLNNDNTTLNFTSILSKLKSNFVIPISIRALEAHILLCDGGDVSKSNCYWFLIQAFGGNRTLLRKCSKGYIPLTVNTGVKPPCSNHLEEIKHFDNRYKYLTLNSWSHFKVNKSRNELTLSQTDGKNEKIIINFRENVTINVTHLIIHSKHKVGFWKIHDVQYRYTTKETTTILGSTVNVTENSVCISMFVSMCPSCNIILTLKNAQNQTKIVEETFTDESGWTEIKLTANDIQTQPVMLSVSTKSNNAINKFWAISNVRRCKKEEFRILWAKSKLKCQLMSGDKNIVDLNETISSSENDCPENTISRFCVPCRWFFESCGQLKVCSKFNKETTCSNFEENLPPVLSLDTKQNDSPLTGVLIVMLHVGQLRKSEKGSPDNSKLFLFISDESADNKSRPELQKFRKDFQINLKKFRLLYECDLQKLDDSESDRISFVIGQNAEITNCFNEINPPLASGTIYNVTAVVINTFKNRRIYKSFSVLGKTTEPLQMSSLLEYLYIFLTLVLIVVVIIIITFVRRRRRALFKGNSLQLSIHSTTNESEDQNDTAHLRRLSNNTTIVDMNMTSKRINIMELEQYIREAVLNGELERQHALLPLCPTKPSACGASKPNSRKNRYADLIAYDHSRVVLKKIGGDKHSDYINANYIDGYKVSRAYIATQGPKTSTLYDFWRMVWQEKVQHVAMVANLSENGVEQVAKYWPGINENVTFNDITIKFVSNKVYATYEHRVFTVIRKKETRKVEQYHFLSWPDHGVPLYPQSLVPFLQSLSQIHLSSKSPVVVHCSAGVGRTGTILLCDICLRMAAEERAVDILGHFRKLRDQRPNMISNSFQYKLMHLVLLECLLGKRTSIPCDGIEKAVQNLLDSKEVAVQMRYLEDTAWQDQTMKIAGHKGSVKVVEEKNRFPTIIPEIQGRVFLKRYPFDDEDSTYINAVRVDDFQSPERFVVTQQPLPNTLGDFWRLVDETDASVIISLNEIDLENEKSCQFWPDTTNPHLVPVDYITLKYTNTLSRDLYNLISLELHVREDYKTIKIISMKNWSSGKNCPEKIEDFLSFWENSYITSRKSNPVIITCFDGARASGLYVAMSFVIEKMKLEQLCDVCQAVRSVRHNRSQFVQEKEQFVFLYQAAAKYISQFEPYANFT